MKRIGVIFGGRSGEHEVSLLSAVSVIEAVDKEKYSVVKIGINHDGKWFLFEGDTEAVADGSWEKTAKPIEAESIGQYIDFALPILHGTFGEDGCIQGLFEILDIPYAGCGVLASSLCMDKAMAKAIFEYRGIPTCKYVLVFAEEVHEDAKAAAEKVYKEFNGTVFVKPSNMGSSVGISKARDVAELEVALEEAAKFDRRIIVEEAVNGREIETGVIGNFRPEAGAVGEIKVAADFYDYSAKYSEDKGTVVQVPAELPKKLAEKVRELAVKAYKAMSCEGFARVDFFLSNDTGELFINEINTIPGFTKYSMFPLIWENAGVNFTELIERIVELGYERYNDKNKRQTVYR